MPDEPATRQASAADRQDWDQIAPRYIAMSEENDRVYQQFRPVLWECLGDIRDLTVLDLGCGHGWLSQEMRATGAAVWGVDGSAAMLSHARAAYPGIPFIEHDLARGLPPGLPAFDRVVASMVLMDVPALDPLIAAVRNVLAPGGRFIFTLPHPCFFFMKVSVDEATGQRYRKVTGYLQPEVWRIENFGGHNHYHRSLMEYVECLRRHRFAVTRLHEPVHTPGPDTPDPAFYRSIPVFLLIEAIPLPESLAPASATGR